MQLNLISELLIIIVILSILSIQDIFLREVSNKLIFLGFFIKFLFFLENSIQSMMLFLILIRNILIIFLFVLLWIKGEIGAGDVKILFLIMLYLPIQSKISLKWINIHFVSDLLQLIIFLLIISIFFFIYQEINKV